MTLRIVYLKPPIHHKSRKIIEQSPEFKELDKEFVSPCNNCGNHLDMKIKMKSLTRMTNFNTYTKETSQCRKLGAGEKTKRS